MDVATESVDVVPSKHFTTVPFKLLLAGLIVILDTSGKLSVSESVEAVKVELLISTSGSKPLGTMDVMIGGHSLRYHNINSDLPSVKHSCSGACQLQLTPHLANWGH